MPSRRPSYVMSLASTLLAALVAATIMFFPFWIYQGLVLDVAWDAALGRGEGPGFLLDAWLVRALFRPFVGVDLSLWDAFSALLATSIVATIVGYWLPFVGFVIAVLVPPAVLRWLGEDGAQARRRGADPTGRVRLG